MFWFLYCYIEHTTALSAFTALMLLIGSSSSKFSAVGRFWWYWRRLTLSCALDFPSSTVLSNDFPLSMRPIQFLCLSRIVFISDLCSTTSSVLGHQLNVPSSWSFLSSARSTSQMFPVFWCWSVIQSVNCRSGSLRRFVDLSETLKMAVKCWFDVCV